MGWLDKLKVKLGVLDAEDADAPKKLSSYTAKLTDEQMAKLGALLEAKGDPKAADARPATQK